MRQSVKEFVELCRDCLPIAEPIYEFGSMQVPGQVGFADLRPIFPGMKYVGTDIRPGPGVDRILDLHEIDLPAETAGTVLCLDTLEHVEFPRKALGEIHRILKPGGVVVMSSSMRFPIHEHPHDYWRFTPEGFRSLLAPFATSVVGFLGREDFPPVVVGIGAKGGLGEDVLARLGAGLERWKARWPEPSEARGK